MSYNSKLKTPTQLSKFMSTFTYKDFDKLMSPEEVYLTKSGSCHDQVMFELAELKNIGIHPVAYFLMAMGKDNVGGETHSFVCWVTGNRAYWFENAWEDHRGITIFNNEMELLESVWKAFSERVPHHYLYFADFLPEEHTVGEDLDTLVNTCMKHAVPMFTFHIET